MKQKLFTLFAAVIIAANAMAQTTHKGHEYVDLGLTSGTLWATCNVGATAPEQAGDYFAWGETTTKSDYSWSTYKYCNGSSSTQTKYCTKSSYGTVDNKTTLEASDDAATANWGGAWRMPTYAEQTELRTECTWKWEKLNGVNGYRVTIKKDTSKSIFLPAAGVLRGTSLEDAGSHGRYWSSSLYESTPCYAYVLYFYSSRYQYEYYYRYLGQSVRPVCSSVQEYTITVSASEGGTATGDGEQFAGCTMTLTATPNEYYEFEKWSDGNTENPRTITVTQDSVFEAIFVENPKYTITLHAENGTISGAESGKQYYEGTALTLTATPNQGYTFAQWSDGVTTAERTITVTQDSTFTAVFEAFTPEYVDLGLTSGTLWATCNVGATAPEQYGDYFAWGETEPKENYDWTNEGDYKWGVAKWNGETYEGMTKYNNEDGLLTLEAADDAATANWGGKWRTPTQKEMQELLDECQRDWTTDYNGTGKAGYIITSKAEGNTNAIFLPAAGYYDQSYLTLVGSQGYYWSSSLYEDFPGFINVLYFGSDFYIGSFNRRCSGYSVRPVCSKDGILTGVETPYIASPDQVRKVMENGTMYIIHDGVRYNVLGVKVK